MKELFEYLKTMLTRKDLIGFIQGSLFSENIINVYFKILEKMNLV